MSPYNQPAEAPFASLTATSSGLEGHITSRLREVIFPETVRQPSFHNVQGIF